MKTGSGGRPWVVLDSPRPPKVDDIYRYWGDPPPEISARCQYWLRQIERGWRPNRRIRIECADCSAEWYGIYMWEFINLICVALGNGRFADYKEPDPVYGPPTFSQWFGETFIAPALREAEDQAILYGNGTGPEN